jgi:hypothetical protein
MITNLLTSHESKHVITTNDAITPSSSNTKNCNKNKKGEERKKTKGLPNPGDYKTLIWWACLSLIAIFNTTLWIWTYLTFDRKEDGSIHINPYQKKQLLLSGIYVFVCAYRSILPRIDLERYCLFDTIFSSIFLGRLAATVAEISFSAQLALFLYKLGENHSHPIAQYISILLVPAITIAQAFCWCGVLTLNHLYHAIEESIWAIAGGLLGCSFLSFALHHSENEVLVRLGFFGCISSILFCAFMVLVDVPMYFRRWKQGQQKVDQHRMFVRKGSLDAWHRRVVTADWDIWKEETVWLTGYFSSAVWLSLLLVHMPAP